MPDTPVPTDARSILLINPTKYLGNLLLAGGLIQEYSRHCKVHNITLTVLLDETFRELCQDSFPDCTLQFFPRNKINQAGFFEKARLYFSSLGKLRALNADIAFNIEEDSATSHLTRLAAARFTLGCSKNRHNRGYDHVIPVDFENRPEQRMHRWFSYYDVFVSLGMPEPEEPSYIHLQLPESDADFDEKLKGHQLDFSAPVIALHAGATKDYKKWPTSYFTTLCKRLIAADMQPLLVGAGRSDREINQTILAELATEQLDHKVINLCDLLSLKELAMLLPRCSYMLGNDSGPFHLGSAVGVKGSVIFGPTNKAIWQPLGKNSELIKSAFTCDLACSKAYCLHDHQCLKEISPSLVFNKILERVSLGT